MNDEMVIVKITVAAVAYRRKTLRLRANVEDWLLLLLTRTRAQRYNALEAFLLVWRETD